MDSQSIILICLLILVLIVFVMCYNNPRERFNSTRKNIPKHENMINIPVVEGTNKHKLMEHAERFEDITFQPDYAWLSQNNLMPWWNSTRHTRNMSYDLRGDVPITPSYVGPWNNSDLI